MQGKFRFSLDRVDATARQFAEVRRQLRESQASVGKSVSRLSGRVSDVEKDFESLVNDQSQSDAGKSNAVVVPAHGGTGVRNVYASPLSLTPRRPVYCLHDGTLGVDCSSVGSAVGDCDADEFISLDALRRVKWRVYTFKDDLNLKLDDAQPTIGLLAEDLDDAGLGFFCSYDGDGVPTGVDYPKLSVAALRLAQQAMGEMDELRVEVARLSSLVGKMGVSTSE
ncbi:MAG: chaperone of endosialidase [Namikivirus tsukuho]|uniref:Chaperone of endosialidase n=1 Tax=Bacteriophage sp. TaxID=38018 RepID=A0ABY5TSS3_9VIRU|nr:MAG: chaperone of endosialidase [Bacteriophage sp.]